MAETHHDVRFWRRHKKHDDDVVHEDRYASARTDAMRDDDTTTAAGTRTVRTTDGDRATAYGPGQHLAPADRDALGTHHARERFGGVNGGAVFFGWLVAVAMAVLLVSILGAIASAVGSSMNFNQDDAERQAGAVSLGAAIAIVVVMAIAYYAGGYVAGRMSRFDGARQGLAVWALGLVVTLLAVGLGWLFGDQYNVLDRVDLPRFPIPTDSATLGGIITAAALVILTLLAAMAGGKVGHRYHDKVDRVASI
ncbi:MAG TPA: TIGR04086 family membrane protein [Nocardioides sp.]|nr:TIGR04086 family membrane protein [Nocardioides sp.]